MNLASIPKWQIAVAILILLAPMGWFVSSNSFSSADVAEAAKAQVIPCEELPRSGLTALESYRRQNILKSQSGDRVLVEEALWEGLPDLGKGRLLTAFRCSTLKSEVKAYGYRREAYLGRATADTIELEPKS